MLPGQSLGNSGKGKPQVSLPLNPPYFPVRGVGRGHGFHLCILGTSLAPVPPAAEVKAGPQRPLVARVSHALGLTPLAARRCSPSTGPT